MNNFAMSVRMPTDEEMFASCRPRYEHVAPFMIDQWPESVRALSFPTKMVEVNPADIRALFDYDADGWKDNARKLADILDAEMDWRRHFIRLNSRSPKDVSDDLITCAGRQAIDWIACSERCLDDVTVAYYAKAPVYICLREPKHMHKDGEFRCFAKDGRVIAVSRYFYNQTAGRLPSPGAMMKAADAFYRRHLAAHFPTVVFDLYDPGGQDETLIELNPYGMSDPCLFDSYEEVEKGGERLSAQGIDTRSDETAQGPRDIKDS